MDRARVEELLTAGCDEFHVPGAQLGVLQGNERVVVWAGTLSDRGSEPVTGSTRFHAGSIAKSLTALVVMDAARRGDLDLDVGCDEQAEGLWTDTPRSLMASTTGRPNVLPELHEPLEGFVARVGAMPRVHPDGRFSYCNAGWSVLDLLLRRRCGAGFEDLAQSALASGGTFGTFGMPDGAAQGHMTRQGAPMRSADSDETAAASAAGGRWWTSADELLDYARLHLSNGAGRFYGPDVQEQRRRYAPVPGATMSDAWGLGWALWDRGAHSAFGWAGYTAGHRAYLRCFPRQDAAVALMTNSAGPILGPPGGSALFDTVLPELLTMLGVPELAPPEYADDGHAVVDLAGRYGPLVVEEKDHDSFLLHAAAFGEPEPIRHHRLGGDSFARDGRPPGGMTVAFDAGLLYLGPFAIPRA
jgi:CubicO group peptidase (beta-lactamase class C family)